MANILVICGGTIPRQQIPRLKKKGVAEVFTPRSTSESIVNYIVSKVKGASGGSKRVFIIKLTQSVGKAYSKRAHKPDEPKKNSDTPQSFKMKSSSGAVRRTFRGTRTAPILDAAK